MVCRPLADTPLARGVPGLQLTVRLASIHEGKGNIKAVNRVNFIVEDGKVNKLPPMKTSVSDEFEDRAQRTIVHVLCRSNERLPHHVEAHLRKEGLRLVSQLLEQLQRDCESKPASDGKRGRGAADAEQDLEIVKVARVEGEPQTPSQEDVLLAGKAQGSAVDIHTVAVSDAHRSPPSSRPERLTVLDGA